jgi:hypothetical protein
VALVRSGLLPKLERIAQGAVGDSNADQRDNVLKGKKNSRHLRLTKISAQQAVCPSDWLILMET